MGRVPRLAPGGHHVTHRPPRGHGGPGLAATPSGHPRPARPDRRTPNTGRSRPARESMRPASTALRPGSSGLGPLSDTSGCRGAGAVPSGSMAARQLGHVASPARASTSRPSEPFPHRVPPSGSGAWVHGPAVAGDRAAQAGQTLEPGAPSKTAPQPARWQPQTTNPGVPVPLGAASSSILGDPTASVSSELAGFAGFEGPGPSERTESLSTGFGVLEGCVGSGAGVFRRSYPAKRQRAGAFRTGGESFTGPPATGGCSRFRWTPGWPPPARRGRGPNDHTGAVNAGLTKPVSARDGPSSPSIDRVTVQGVHSSLCPNRLPRRGGVEGGGAGNAPPRQPLPGTREAWPPRGRAGSTPQSGDSGQSRAASACRSIARTSIPRWASN